MGVARIVAVALDDYIIWGSSVRYLEHPTSLRPFLASIAPLCFLPLRSDVRSSPTKLATAKSFADQRRAYWLSEGEGSLHGFYLI